LAFLPYLRFTEHQMKIDRDLVAKYNQPVPRYTSYPTVPFWKDFENTGSWNNDFKRQFSLHNKSEGISLYLHLPFCETMCSFCGCNKRITTNHQVEEEYIDALRKEWQLYINLMDAKPVIRELHLGGGTPTFFAPENLKKIMGFIFESSMIHPGHEFSFEGHPNNTTRQHLQTLYDLGFRRVSFGVQDNDPEVQRVINRIQPLENLVRVTRDAREVGYKSVNYDLVYGLPKQTQASIQKTIAETIELRPDRIAFYSYAHVPWTSKGQRLFDENDLPSADEKLQLYITGKEMFAEAGYFDIGMDHFALPHDDLFIASQNGTMHRNFMGYTTQNTKLLLGLGVSSISDLGVAFGQNNKLLQEYYETVNAGKLPVTRGFLLSDEDIDFRQYILDISCKGHTSFKPAHLILLYQYTFRELALLQGDGLVNYDERSIQVTPLGRHFIRNICKAFDLRLLRNEQVGENKMFSKAI
jgi:oxygen-independent coproporphyrinogen III oxidase